MSDKTRTERFLQTRLYAITCPPTAGQSYDQMVEAACAGGAQVIQLRDKILTTHERYVVALRLRAICAASGALFIINDDLAMALAVEADGVHLGQDDMPVFAAKAVVRRAGLADFLVGCSTHSLDQARKAQVDGADYIAIGPVFATPTKPTYLAVGLDLVRSVTGTVPIPHVAIGGIGPENVAEVVAAGAQRVAIVRAVCGSANISASAQDLRKRVESAALAPRG